MDRREVRVYKEKDGVVYDSETATVLHYRDNCFVDREILAVTPDGHYFLAFLTGGLTDWTYVRPIGKLHALMWSIKHDGPDDVLRSQGVKVSRPIESDEPFNLLSSTLLGGRKRLFGYDFLEQNYDRRLFVFQGREICGIVVMKKVYPLTQRQALQWTLDCNTPLETFYQLGWDYSSAKFNLSELRIRYR